MDKQINYDEKRQIELIAEGIMLFKKLPLEAQFYALQYMHLESNRKIELSQILKLGYDCANPEVKSKVLNLLRIDKRVIED